MNDRQGIVWRSPYPANVTEVQLVAEPRFATLLVRSDDGLLEVRLANPRPMTSLGGVFDTCWEVRIINQNMEDHAQREFGSYRVEFWDEDNPFAQVECDEYEATKSDDC